ncbi:MAG: hypothetical protein ACI8PB_003426 [Desulforhopalus sp.]
MVGFCGKDVGAVPGNVVDAGSIDIQLKQALGVCRIIDIFSQIKAF